MPEKASNKVKKKANEFLRKITNEEYNDDAERFRDKDDKKFTWGPHHRKEKDK